jgi:DNA-binding SARP family transcriptional activator/TolB-like protein
MTNQETSVTGKLELRLLGPVSLSVDGAVVEERLWTRRKSRSLVKILALAPRHQLHREQLIEYLWPEIEPDLAANNLNKAIHAARRALEPALKSGADSRFILTHDQQVILSAPGELWVDVAAFEQQAAAALKTTNATDYEAALELYGGELLPEDRYEDWAVARREQLRRLSARLLLRLAQLYEADGQFQPSIERYQQLIALDPADEEIHRRLMRLYARTGNRHEALAQYQQCREALRRELDAEPEPATVALYEQIAAGHFQQGVQPENIAAKNEAVESTALTTLADHHPELSSAPLALQSASPRRWRVALPVMIGVIALALGAWLIFYRGLEPRTVEAIAVLPFTNGSADANVEYLSDGITESLINSLSRLPRLRVMARTTAFRYKNRELDPQAIGRDLKVQAVLTGRVTQRGDELVIQADLIDVRDGAQLWGEKYNRRLSDILVVQSEIAREITDRLRLRLTTDEQQMFARQPTGNTEAYQNYLKGRYYWNRRTVADTQRAIEHFNQAIALDPAFALAFAGLADAWHTLSGLRLPPTEAIPRARAAAERALELDDRLAAAHASLAIIRWRYDWKPDEAASEFRRAIALDPNYAPAHQWYGLLLTYQRQFEAARVELKQAQQLDPLSLIINSNLGLQHYFAREYDAAIAQFRRTLELDQNFPFAHFFLGWAYEQKGEHAQAVAEFERAVQLDETPAALAYLGHGLARAGNRQAAQEILDKLQSLARERYVSPYYLAVVCTGLGEKEQALAWLARAAEDHSDAMVLIGVEPKFDSLRSSPQFNELLSRIGLKN